MKQDRRSVNLPTSDYEELSHLQAQIRVAMKDKNVEQILSKTAMTKVLSTLIKNAKVEELVKLLI